MSENDKMRRIRFASDETGWAEELGDGTYKVMNIPLERGIGLHDIVTVKTVDGWLVVDEVIKRAYAQKVAVHYDTKAECDAIRQDLIAAGCHVEGYLGPSVHGRGVLGVQAPAGVDVLAIAGKHVSEPHRQRPRT